MTIRVRDSSGVLHTLSRIRVRDATNTLRTISRVRVRDSGNVLRTINMSGVIGDGDVVLDSYEEYQSASGAASSGTVTSDPITALGQFGTPPYTYKWSRLSGATSIAITTPNSNSTTFSAMVTGEPKSGTFRCKVVDSLGQVKYSAPLTVELEWIDTR